jgi:hypothetical protein
LGFNLNVWAGLPKLFYENIIMLKVTNFSIKMSDNLMKKNSNLMSD